MCLDQSQQHNEIEKQQKTRGKILIFETARKSGYVLQQMISRKHHQPQEKVVSNGNDLVASCY